MKVALLLPLAGASTVLAGQIRDYYLVLQMSWLSLDGNGRPVMTINGTTPGPVIEADEGDTLRIRVENKLLGEATLHWHGIYQSDRYWNDGVPGVTQWPLEPRNSYTYEMKVENQTGSYFYHGHFGPAFADGQRGPLWIRPAPHRERPYSLISSKQDDMAAMLAAEKKPHHAMVSDWNFEGMEVLLIQYRDTGASPHCAASIIFNNAGRSMCVPRHELDKYDPERKRDSLGCLPPLHGAQYMNPRECVDTDHDFYVFQPDSGDKYMFMNFIHPGSFHELRLSIDQHDMWIVAADGDFVPPKKVQAINVNMGDRISVLVPLDQKPGEYAIRASSVVPEQLIQGISILRYPGVQESRVDGIMQIPDSKPWIDLNGTMIDPESSRMMDEMKDLSAFPPRSPPTKADYQLKMRIERPEPALWLLSTAPHEFWRQQIPPVLWNNGSRSESTFGGFKNGSVVDIIFENKAQGDHPFHKHNHKVFIIGEGDGFFRWPDVDTAIKEAPQYFNMVDPPFRDGARLATKNGAWTVIRYTIDFPALSMLHCHKIAHFAAGQQIILMEGAEAMKPLPEYIKELPHAEFQQPLRYGPID